VTSVSAEREIWQERAGAFYPLVVAAQAQTRLPLTGRLVPSEDDLKTSLCWLPAVGIALGVFWAFVAAACFEIGLSQLASAVVVVIAMIATGDLCFERALASSTSKALGRWRRAAGQGEDGDDPLLSTVAVVSLSIAMRAAAVASLAPSEATAGLIAAAVLSRWGLSLGPLVRSIRSTDSEIRALLRYVLIAVAVAVVMAVCQGASGLVLMLLVGGAMFLLSRNSSEASKNISGASGLALITLVLALLCQ
tara:strand:+ start:12606 stop:13355 length:750 start_codon:yes stop_codon:yes gene_type:complete